MLSIDALATRYQAHAETYYRRANGKPTGAARNVRHALRDLCGVRLPWGSVLVRVGAMPAEWMTPAVLRAVQEALAESGRMCRQTANYRLVTIKQVFVWGESQGLVSADVAARLSIVSALKRGRSAAYETPGVKPVEWSQVSDTISVASLKIATMIEVHWHTGMRPGEVVQMRWSCIDQTQDPWLYRPPEHKTEHHGHERVVSLGPIVQSLLNQWRKHHTGDALWPITRQTYSVTVRRVNERHGIPRWSVNQIRHSTATRLRREHGIEVARAVLGHRSIRMTEHYAEADERTASDAMREFG